MKAAIDELLWRLSDEMRSRGRQGITTSAAVAPRLRIGISERDVRYCLWGWDKTVVIWRAPPLSRMLRPESRTDDRMHTRALTNIYIESAEHRFRGKVPLIPSGHIEEGHVVAYTWADNAGDDIAPVIVTYQWRCVTHPECRADAEMGKACLAAQRKTAEE